MKKFLLLKFIIIFMTKDNFGWLFDPTKPIEFDSKINIRGSLHNHDIGFTLNSTVDGFIEINNNDMRNLHSASDAPAIKNIDLKSKFGRELERFKALIIEYIKANEKRPMTHEFSRNTKEFIDYLKYFPQKAQSEDISLNIEKKMKEILEILHQIYDNNSANDENGIFENFMRHYKIKSDEFERDMKSFQYKLFEKLMNGIKESFFDGSQLISKMPMSMRKYPEYFRRWNENYGSYLKKQRGGNGRVNLDKSFDDFVKEFIDILNLSGQEMANRKLIKIDSSKESPKNPLRNLNNESQDIFGSKISMSNDQHDLSNDSQLKRRQQVSKSKLTIDNKSNSLEQENFDRSDSFSTTMTNKIQVDESNFESTEIMETGNNYSNVGFNNCIGCELENQSINNENEQKLDSSVEKSLENDSDKLHSSVIEEVQQNFETETDNSKINFIVDESQKLHEIKNPTKESNINQNCTNCDHVKINLDSFNKSAIKTDNNSHQKEQQVFNQTNENSKNCSDCGFNENFKVIPSSEIKINETTEKIDKDATEQISNENPKVLNCSDCGHDEKSLDQSILLKDGKMQMKIESNEGEMRISHKNVEDLDGNSSELTTMPSEIQNNEIISENFDEFDNSTDIPYLSEKFDSESFTENEFSSADLSENLGADYEVENSKNNRNNSMNISNSQEGTNLTKSQDNSLRDKGENSSKNPKNVAESQENLLSSSNASKDRTNIEISGNSQNFTSEISEFDNSITNENLQDNIKSGDDESPQNDEKFSKTVDRLQEISQELKSENFTEDDLIKVENYRNEIRELNEFFRDTILYKNVSQLYSELLGLTEALEVMRLSREMANSNDNVENLQHLETIVFKLNVIENSEENSFVKERAHELKSQLQEILNRIKDHQSQEEEKLQNQVLKINNSLSLPENDNLNFLNISQYQLNSTIHASKNSKTIENANNLLQKIKILRNDIFHIQLELKEIENSVKVPSNETELKQLTSHKEYLQSMKKQPEPSIYNKAIELDESIKKVIKEYQIKEVNLALDKMNVSLETAQSGNEINNNMMELKNLEMKIESLDESEEHSKDIEKVKQSISQLKRSLPMKSAKAAIRNNARVLYTIVNESINIINATQSDIDNLNNQFLKLERLNSSRFDLTSLNVRKNIIINDYNRISNDLSDIRERLEVAGLAKTNVKGDKIIKEYNDTSEMMEVLAELDNLLRDSRTSKLYKETIRNVQEIEQLKGSLNNTFKTIGRLQNLEKRHRMNQSHQTESLIESYGDESSRMEQENGNKLIKNSLRSSIIDNTTETHLISSPPYQFTLNKQEFSENEDLDNPKSENSLNSTPETNLKSPSTQRLDENEFSTTTKDFSSTTITNDIQSLQQPTITDNTMNYNQNSSTDSSETSEIYNDVVATIKNVVNSEI